MAGIPSHPCRERIHKKDSPLSNRISKESFGRWDAVVDLAPNASYATKNEPVSICRLQPPVGLGAKTQTSLFSPSSVYFSSNILKYSENLTIYEIYRSSFSQIRAQLGLPPPRPTNLSKPREDPHTKQRKDNDSLEYRIPHQPMRQSSKFQYFSVLCRIKIMGGQPGKPTGRDRWE